MNVMKIIINPTPKPRMTRSDKWKKRPCVLRYRAFSDELRYKLNKFELSDNYKVTFGVALPKSYSKKKALDLEGKKHQLTPDLDNLIKALQDSLMKQDNKVHKIIASKVWSKEGFIEIENL